MHEISQSVTGGTEICGEFQKKINPLSTNPTKWSITLKQFAGRWRRFL